MLLFLFVGLLLLRFADRQLIALLFQLPPRITRFEPFGRHPKSVLDVPPPVPNPNGILSLSPGLRAASYPGSDPRNGRNPERVASVPHIRLVEAQFVALQQPAELVLKRVGMDWNRQDFGHPGFSVDVVASRNPA